MSHLTNEEIVLSYYDEPESGPAREHLASCPACRAELGRLAAVLDRVTPVEVDDPPAGYEEQVWSRLQWKLRGEARRRSPLAGWLAAAAAIAVAFAGGLFWNARRATPVAPQVAVAEPAAPATDSRERILLVVVGDHFAASERILVELTNLTPEGETDITREREHAQTLLASNRLYRRSAAEIGEESVATLLDELEPVLLQIARSDEQVSARDLRSLQKRVEAKGLVFKLRVVRAGTSAAAPAAPLNHGTI